MVELLNNRQIRNHTIWLRVQAAGIYGDDFTDKPFCRVKIDTGFTGWLILPKTAMDSIHQKYFMNPTKITFTEFDNTHKIEFNNTYDFLKIRIAASSVFYSQEIAPEYVSFYEKSIGVLGMKLLKKLQSVLTIDAKNDLFSLTVG